MTRRHGPEGNEGYCWCGFFVGSDSAAWSRHLQAASPPPADALRRIGTKPRGMVALHWPEGVCLSCGNIVNAETGEGHDAERDEQANDLQRSIFHPPVATAPAPGLDALTEALHGARGGTCAMPDGGPDDWDCQGVAADIHARLAGQEGGE